MSQQTKGPKAFKSNAGISAPLDGYLRMKQDAAADSAGFTGTVEPAGAYDQDVGISQSFVNKAGDHVSVMLTNQEGTRKVRCASICAIGDRLYPTTGGKVDTIAMGGGGTAGGAIGSGGFIALEACATAGGLVEALPIGFGGAKGGILFVGTKDSTAITGTAEQTFDTNSVSIPANGLKVGDVLKIKARVVVTGQNGTDTEQVQLYLGSVKILDCAARDLDTNEEVVIEAIVVVTDLGATGHVKGFGTFRAGDLISSVALAAFTLASTSIDTTAAQSIHVTSIFSSSNAGNTSVLRDLIVELVRQ